MDVKKGKVKDQTFLVCWLTICIFFYIFNSSVIFISLLIIPFCIFYKNKSIKAIIIVSLIFFLYLALYFLIKSYNFIGNMQTWIDSLFGFSIRWNLINFINNSYDDKTSSFINMILFNYKNDIAYDFYNKAINLSIVHLIAVSGFHLSIITMSINKIFRSKKIFAYWINVVLISFYSYLLSFSFGSLRILICILLKPMLKRFELEYIEIVCMSGIIIAMMVPYCFNNMSYILSYLGTFAVLTIKKFNFNNIFFETVAINLLATLVNLPFIVLMNQQISLFAIINSFVFAYLFCFIFIYFLLFSWLPFLSVVHLFIINCSWFLVGNFYTLNIMINLSKWNTYVTCAFYFCIFISIEWYEWKCSSYPIPH